MLLYANIYRLLFQNRNTNRTFTDSRGERTADRRNYYIRKHYNLMNSCILILWPPINIPGYDLPSLRDLAIVSGTTGKFESTYFPVVLFLLSLVYFIFITQTWFLYQHGVLCTTQEGYQVQMTSTSAPREIQRTSLSGSSPEGDCRKTDTMHMPIRMHFLYGTNIIKLPETEQIVHTAFSFVVVF